MILLLGGTADGRALLQDFVTAGYKVIYTTVSEYGGSLSAFHGAEEIIIEKLTENRLVEIIEQKGVSYLVDATHPYARVVSVNAVKAAKNCNIPCLRYLRPDSELPVDTDIHIVTRIQEAVDKAAQLGDNIFLSTGSNNLEELAGGLLAKGKNVTARVLPAPGIIEKCLKIGLNPGNIMAIQGPFSKEFNIQSLQHFKSEVLVTKESGSVGGFEDKVEAARALKIPLVMISRPQEKSEKVFRSYEEILRYIKEE